MVNTLRPFRSSSNFVGGGAALNRKWSRLSDDMDIFGDVSSLPYSARLELEALRKAGLTIDTLFENDATVEAIVTRNREETRIQWMDDPETSKRFFPAVADDDFGFRLHQADNAANKVLCASRRKSAARDAVDLVAIVRDYAPLGPLIWAACAKDSKLNPLKIINDVRQNAFGYADVELKTVRMDDRNSLTRGELRSVIGPALEAAADYCEDVAPEVARFV